jgi:glycosyltransferase involved in cell wall biosynthesis
MDPKRIEIWHNILWSSYKADVFSAIHRINNPREFLIEFFQIAETAGDRRNISPVDTSRHAYPFRLLFRGSYGDTSIFSKLRTIFAITRSSRAELFILTGYERPEIWVQIVWLRLFGKKIAFFCDSTINDKPQSFLRGLVKRALFQSADGFFCYGVRSSAYVAYYGADPSRVYQRCQAAALPLSYTAESALQQRKDQMSCLRPGATRFLYIGRLSQEKGLETLINAFSKVCAQQLDARLVLVGSGPMRGRLETLVESLSLQGSVEFLGSLSGDSLFDEYSKATAFVLPSTSEPWGLVVNEALAYGCPVVVSERCGCVPELVIEGQTGLSHRANDIDDLAAKMLLSQTQFADIERTAKACIDLMARYTPDLAAAQIIAGCRRIFGGSCRS